LFENIALVLLGLVTLFSVMSAVSLLVVAARTGEVGRKERALVGVAEKLAGRPIDLSYRKGATSTSMEMSDKTPALQPPEGAEEAERVVPGTGKTQDEPMVKEKSLNAPESTSNATSQEPTGDTPTREDLLSGKENSPYQNLPEELVKQLIREQRNIKGSLQALEGRYASLEQLDGYLPILKELETHLPELQEAVHFLKIATISQHRDPMIADPLSGQPKIQIGNTVEPSYSSTAHPRIVEDRDLEQAANKTKEGLETRNMVN
jgi:hypothetical protein